MRRCHALLRRAYGIISSKISNASSEFILQMITKAADHIVPDEIVPTLIVFGVYPGISSDFRPLPSIIQRAEAIRKSVNEVRF